MGCRYPVCRVRPSQSRGSRSSSCRATTEVDKVISFLEKAWRRLLEMGREVQKNVERKN